MLYPMKFLAGIIAERIGNTAFPGAIVVSQKILSCDKFHSEFGGWNWIIIINVWIKLVLKILFLHLTSELNWEASFRP